MPYGQRGNWRPPRREPGHCRYCDTPIYKRDGVTLDPRRSWCSQRCNDEGWLRMSWSAMRAHILKRDGERCAICGTTHPGLNGRRQFGWRRRFLHNYWVEVCDLGVWPWEVDHIVTVQDGGTDDPANLRVLCHACHITSGVERRKAKREAADPQERLTLGAA